MWCKNEEPKEGEESKELYTHYYADGEDEKLKTYEDKGYIINKLTIRDFTSGNEIVAWDIVSQIFLLSMMTVFVYNNLWNLGDKDKGAVIYKRKKEDKLKGLKIGLIASIPSFVITTIIFVGRATFAKEVSVALYAFLNAHWYKLIILISGGGYFHELKIWEVIVFYALILFVPLVAHIAYTKNVRLPRVPCSIVFVALQFSVISSFVHHAINSYPGLFGLFNYEKEGPGINKDAPPKKTFVVFFETFFRNFWKFVTINLVYCLISIPVITNGMAKVGMTNVCRNTARDKHSFGLSDFFETIKKNLAQSLIAGIINTVVYALLIFDFFFFWGVEGVPGVIGTGIALAMLITFTMMNYYLWTLIITFDYTLKQAYTNSFKFVFINFKNSILVFFVNILLVLISTNKPLSFNLISPAFNKSACLPHSPSFLAFPI